MARKPAKVREPEPLSLYLQQKNVEALHRLIARGQQCPSPILKKLPLTQRAYLVQAALTESSSALEEAGAADWEEVRTKVRSFLKVSTPYGACRVRCFWKLWSKYTEEETYICLSDMTAFRRNGSIVYRERSLTKKEVLESDA